MREKEELEQKMQDMNDQQKEAYIKLKQSKTNKNKEKLEPDQIDAFVD